MEKYIYEERDIGEIAARLALRMKKGDIIIFEGELGVGKTRLIKHICSYLGIDKDRVKSPSFSIHNVYCGEEVKINHFDLYRLDHEEEIDYLNLLEETEDCITFIEWGAKFLNYLSGSCKFIIMLKYVDNLPYSREIKILGPGNENARP